MADSDDLINVFDFNDGNDPTDQHLIDLFSAMKADASPEELAGEISIVAAMLQAMQPVPTNVVPLRSFSMRQRFATSKTATKAAIISGVVLLSASAAAAGGVLPGPEQSFVSRAVSHIGIHVENPEKSAAEANDATSTSSTIDDSSSTKSADDNTDTKDDSSNGVGPNATGDAKDGLCHAFIEHQNNPAKPEDSVAMKNLQDAATKAGQAVEVFCASSTSTSDDHGSGNPAGSDDGNKITVPGQSGSGSDSGSSGNTGGGLDDTTQSTTHTVTVPAQVDPSVSTSSLPDDNGGSNKGGGTKP